MINMTFYKKISFLTTIILSVMVFHSCHSQEKENPMDKKEIEISENYFKKHHFNNNEENFNNVNENLLGIQPDVLQKGYNDIIIFNEPTNYRISKEGKYIKIGNDILPDLDSIQSNIANNIRQPYFEELLSLNKIIYQNDLTSILNIASKDPDLAIDLVVMFNYEKNESLLQTAIRNIQNWEDVEQSNRLSFVFFNNNFKIRERLLKGLQQKNDFIYALTFYLADNKEKITKVNGVPSEVLEKAIAYILQLGFEKKNDIDIQTDKSYTLLNNIYVSHPELKEIFQKNKYYGYVNLEKYSKNYELLKEDNQEKKYSTVQDADGFTNLRKEKNSLSEVLQTIRSGEKVEILDSSGDWWLVVTKQDRKGYVHKSRVKSN